MSFRCFVLFSYFRAVPCAINCAMCAYFYIRLFLSLFVASPQINLYHNSDICARVFKLFVYCILLHSLSFHSVLYSCGLLILSTYTFMYQLMCLLHGINTTNLWHFQALISVYLKVFDYTFVKLITQIQMSCAPNEGSHNLTRDKEKT